LTGVRTPFVKMVGRVSKQGLSFSVTVPLDSKVLFVMWRILPVHRPEIQEVMCVRMVEHVLTMLRSPVHVPLAIQEAIVKSTSMIVPVDPVKMVPVALMECQTTLAAV